LSGNFGFRTAAAYRADRQGEKAVDSLGKKLRQAREEKGCTLEQVSRETNIAARYLEALEAEDFLSFPAEPYLLGFLRNYSEYLGLDPQEQLARYRSLKLQEQAVPIEQLLHSPVPVRKIIIIAAVFLAVLGAGGGAYYFFALRPLRETGPAVQARQPAEYPMDGETLERRLYTGDFVLVPLGESSCQMVLSALGDAVSITGPQGQVMIDLGQEAAFDLNSDGQPELRIIVVDFAKNSPAAGALLRFERINVLPSVDVFVPEGTSLAAAAIIPASANAYPFTAQLSFQGYCMFRWEVLFERDRPGRNEQYFQRGEELSIQAQNGVRVWTSNAQALKLQIIGGGRTVPVELGAAGEVVVADIRWERDGDNYRLVLAHLN
jgi:cytoskeletal protein RodZ